MDETNASRKVYVTLPDTVYDDLEGWADYQGRPTANLASYLIELGIREAKGKGEFKTTKKSSSNESKGD